MRYPTVIRFVRKLRGGSQAHLIQADDNHFYALKSPQNPQGTRVLVNEYLGSKVFRNMGIGTAAITPILVTQEFLDSSPDVRFELKSHRVVPRPGLHLGSRYEVPPDKVAIYDFIPESLIPRVNNAKDFVGALIADQWLCNQDARQFVFFPDQSSDSTVQRGFQAVAIDHGFCFGGTKWNLFDSPPSGVYFQNAIYELSNPSELDGWLQRLQDIDRDRLHAWISETPTDWLAGEGPALELLVARLLKRKKRVPELIEATLQHTHIGRTGAKRTSNATLLPLCLETA